jgi:hypothetical protein
MSRYSASTALRDHCKPFLRCLPRRQHGLFLALCRGLLACGKANLSEACRAAGGGRICRWVERASLLLEHLPWDALLSRHAHRMRQRQAAWKLIVHDTTALPKPWAEKMEGLATVHDGCMGELVTGYTLCVSVGVGRGDWDLHPIRSLLINPVARDFRSHNRSLQEHLQSILDDGIGTDLLHVFDRGFDDEKMFHFLDGERISWMIRLKEKRTVRFRGEAHPLSVVAATILAERPAVRDGITYAQTDIGVTITHDGAGNTIPPETRTYALVAVRRPQYKKPMLLLLNSRVHGWREAVTAYARYLDRFDVEHTIRLWKQTLDPACAQLMTCIRLQGLLHLQMFLLDFLLREAQDGRDPFGRGLHTILQRDYLHSGETLTDSPYVTARALRDLLHRDTRQALCPPRAYVPRVAWQPSLLSPTMLDML